MILLNIENVKIGDKFTTKKKYYKCLELDTNVKGNQQIAQDKEIARWIDTELTNTNKRCKNEFVITNIRTIPLDRIDNRSNNGSTSKYEKYIDVLLLEAIANNHGVIQGNLNTIFTDHIQLLSNEWVDLYTKGDIIAASKYKVSKFTIEQYKRQIHQTIHNMLTGSIKRLCKTNHISHRKTYLITSNKYGCMLADEYELNFHDKILEIENTVLQDQEVTRQQIAINADIRSDFYNDMQIILRQETNNDVWTYRSIHDMKLLNYETHIISDELKRLTDTLILSIHKALMDKEGVTADGETYKPWQSKKLLKFVTECDCDIFKEHSGEIIESDIFAYNCMKAECLKHSKRDSLDWLPF